MNLKSTEKKREKKTKCEIRIRSRNIGATNLQKMEMDSKVVHKSADFGHNINKRDEKLWKSNVETRCLCLML